MKAGLLYEALAYQVGEFIAKVHALGIYFRGLHIGNIVRTPSGDLGLIDVSELSIYWSLSRYRKLRNFARFWRVQEDAIEFGEANMDAMVKGYVSSLRYTEIWTKKITKRLKV
jgi:tRNA A-37 threonylcarbamoyl transferase component Bud32